MNRWLLRTRPAMLLALLLLARPAAAQIGSDRYSSIVMDAQTGVVLSAASADEYRFPASLTKMMTLYMLFEALRDRRISLNQPVPVSASASSMPPTKLGLLPGTYITVEQALLGLVTKSANDAAAALGEMMGGDEERFAQMMTLRARALGMTRTTFRNASGLPDWSQVTTARDMALLARHIIQDFPSYYQYFSVPSFVFQGRRVLNHQRMLQTYPGADGLKTGYIEASGYNVVTSALRGETRLIGVVLGAQSGGERDAHMTALLDQGFDRTGAPLGTSLVAVRRDGPSSRMAALIAAAQAQSPVPATQPPAYQAYAPQPFTPSPYAVSIPAPERPVRAVSVRPLARAPHVAEHRAGRTDRVRAQATARPLPVPAQPPTRPAHATTRTATFSGASRTRG